MLALAAPLQAEGYRHLVSLITNYGMQYVKPTIGSGVMTDIGVVALSQSCVSLHAWYFSRFDQVMLDLGPPGGRPRLAENEVMPTFVSPSCCALMPLKARSRTSSCEPSQSLSLIHI